MLKFSPLQWTLAVALVLLYVITCVRVGRRMQRIGRSGVAWFFITFFFTAIPACIYLMWRNFAWLRRGQPGPRAHAGRLTRGESAGRDEATIRCPRCRTRISPAELQTATLPKTCPTCGSLLDEEFMA